MGEGREEEKNKYTVNSRNRETNTRRKKESSPKTHTKIFNENESGSN